MKVDFIDIPELPWLFRLPFQGKKAKTQEPIKHRRKLKRLTKAIFRIPDDSSSSSLIEKMSNASIQFERGDEKQLILEFDNCHSLQQHQFQELPLIIRY